MDKLVQFYLNNTINLRHLTQRIISCHTHKWRSYRDHRLCDVTSTYVFVYSRRAKTTAVVRSVEPVLLSFPIRSVNCLLFLLLYRLLHYSSLLHHSFFETVYLQTIHLNISNATSHLAYIMRIPGDDNDTLMYHSVIDDDSQPQPIGALADDQ